jgi:hypothetical protein
VDCEASRRVQRRTSARPLELTFDGMGRLEGRLIRGRLPHPTPPPSERKEQAHDEQRSKDQLVVPSKPERQVNIKVVAPVFREARRDSGKWTSPIIDRYDKNFDGDECDENERPLELAARGTYGNDEYAADEEGPGDGVEDLHGTQRRWGT